MVVHAGDAGRTIGVALQKAGVVKTSKAFADVAAGNPQAGSIQPGTYALRTRMSAASALDMLLDPANRTVPRVTVREGLWKTEVIKALSKGTGRPLAEYQAALKNPTALGLPACGQGQRRGLPVPGDVRVRRGRRRHHPAADHGRQGARPAARRRGSRRPTPSGC